jgi:homoserine kinase
MWILKESINLLKLTRMEHSVKVFAPASISNVGPGFDLMGFAIDEPGDVLIIRANASNSLKIINNTQYQIPEDPEVNVATVAVSSLLKAAGSGQGFDFCFETKIKPGSGIGSSAASCTAAVVGVNELLNNPFTKEELLPFAMEGETLASGSEHADNIAPALLGGFILIRSYDPIDIISLKYPENLFCTVVHPDIEIKTIESRKLIPKEFPVKTVLQQCGNIAGLVAGLTTSDYKLIGRSLDDSIAEPIRAGLIPGYLELKSKLHENGALGGNISGSGPAIFAFSDSQSSAEKVSAFMRKTFDKLGINNNVYISKVSKKGTRIID